MSRSGFNVKTAAAKLTMRSTPRPAPDDCSHITGGTAVTASDYRALWLLRDPAAAGASAISPSLLSAPSRQRQTLGHLLYLAIKAVLIDDGARTSFSLLNQ